MFRNHPLAFGRILNCKNLLSCNGTLSSGSTLGWVAFQLIFNSILYSILEQLRKCLDCLLRILCIRADQMRKQLIRNIDIFFGQHLSRRLGHLCQSIFLLKSIQFLFHL